MNYQILKLKSGEEIISDIISQTKTKYTLKNPYIFIYDTSLDMNTGIPFEMTIVKDWLHLSDEKTIMVPINHVVSLIVPSPSAKALYINEMKRSKEFKRVEKLIKKNNKDMNKNLENVDTPPQGKEFNPQEMMNVMNQLFGNMMPNEDETPEEQYNTVHKKRNNPRNNQPMIHMSMVFPPEVIIELMEAGIIQLNDMKKLAKEVKRKMRYTGDETHRPDFGNKYSDWNPDLGSDDYKSPKAS